MTPQERDREVMRFDREIEVGKDTKPLSPKQQLLWELSQRNPKKSIQVVPLDTKLRDKAIAAAKRQGKTLEEFIVESIQGKVALHRR